MEVVTFRSLTTVVRALSIVALVYAFFLPWPASFGQTGYGYGNNLGYGDNQEFFDLSGLWLDDASQTDFLVVHDPESGEAAMLEYWTDSATPGVGYAALSYAETISPGAEQEQIGTFVSAPSSNNGLRMESSVFRIDGDTILLRLDSCEDTYTERMASTGTDYCDNVVIGARRTLTR